MGKQGILLVVSGPSGSGKSTLCRRLVERTDVKVSVSATTRARGETEVEGKDYYFMSEAEFRLMIAADELLEYAEVFGNYYGTPAGPVREMLASGHTVILEIDVQGAAQVFERFEEARGVLVLPPSDEELERRLHDRGRDNAEVIAGRLAKAQWEIKEAKASGKYEDIIINDDLERAVDEAVALVQVKTSDRTGD
jgi:guanylate kinase